MQGKSAMQDEIQIYGKNYEEMLKELGMFSEQGRYLRGGMIIVYKLFTSIAIIETNDFFLIDRGRETRGYNKKIRKKA